MRDELRSLFLFEALTDEQLDWLAGRGERRTYDASVVVYREGEPSTELFVLLAGRLRMSRLVNGDDVVVIETDHRGAYAGAVRAYVELDEQYDNSVVTLEPSSFFVLPGPAFAEFMHAWFPMAVHLLDGLFLGIRNIESTVRQREHLARLGSLSANLAHELNNPAAAAVRAVSQLGARIKGMRNELGAIAQQQVSPAEIARLVASQEAAVERAGQARHEHRSAMQGADREDELLDRLDELGVAAAQDLAAVFADAGLDVAWLDSVAHDVGADQLEGGLRWLAGTLETESLLAEIHDAAERISTLVSSVKQYSFMDSGAVQDVDVHVGLDSTVVMLGHKLQGVEVERDYDRSLPTIPAYGAELNQVWTNLIDNAADAMGQRGRLLLRTARDGAHLLVEVGDDGPGIPEPVQDRIFEAFFTTKPPGEGSGLGLDNAQRIVERRHHGTLTFTTGSAGTLFRVRLPLAQELG